MNNQNELFSETIRKPYIYVYDKELRYIYTVVESDFQKNKNRLIPLPDKELTRLSRLNLKKMIKLFHENKRHYKNKYIHITTYQLPHISELIDATKNYNSNISPPSIYYNPIGLWVGCGSDWINFVKKEVNDVNKSMYAWSLATFIYEICVNDTVLKINNVKEFKDFITKYSNKKTKDINNIINWKKVKKDYNGLIICPYLGTDIFGHKNATDMWMNGNVDVINAYYEKLLENKQDKNIMFLAEWYRHWHTGSGVIWNKNGVDEIKLLKHMNTFDNYDA